MLVVAYFDFKFNTNDLIHFYVLIVCFKLSMLEFRTFK